MFLTVLIAVLILGTVGFMAAEGRSLGDAFYFTIVTVATVGYGDIHPETQLGKVLAILLIVMGVGTFLGVIANATEAMLNRREKEVRLEKLRMVIGVFFSEVGTQLLTIFSDVDPDLPDIRKELIVTTGWEQEDFIRVNRSLKGYDYGVEVRRLDLAELCKFLTEERAFLVRLLENPILLEHESFTDSLQAVFHLAEELTCRNDLQGLPDSDLAHLAGDVKRAYGMLVHQWLDYMRHLKNNYPYLFSLAMRTNPFDRQASPVVG